MAAAYAEGVVRDEGAAQGEASARGAGAAKHGGGALAHDGRFWRRLSRLCTTRGPWWLVRYAPLPCGVAGAALIPSARRAVLRNLRRIRGPGSRLRDARELAETLVTYAGCFAEVLSNGTKNARVPDLVVRGADHMADALSDKKGLVMVTAHTAGWELAGPVLAEHHHLGIVLVMEAEKDEEARKLHDEARRATGHAVAHVGGDPLASLELLRHLRRGAAVAVQLDRMPPGIRGRKVRLFDGDGEVPEGPLRLAQVSGAPIVPVFCARLGYRRYYADIGAPIRLARRADEAERGRAAQAMADAMTSFVRANPTQWFHFQSG
jgi:lauroyl/myristoyl acyltransferase